MELQWNEQEEEDADLETIGQSLKLRGGKLFVSDEDEEDEEEDEDVIKGAPAPVERTPVDEKNDVDKEADALADLLGKVSLGSK